MGTALLVQYSGGALFVLFVSSLQMWYVPFFVIFVECSFNTTWDVRFYRNGSVFYNIDGNFYVQLPPTYGALWREGCLLRDPDGERSKTAIEDIRASDSTIKLQLKTGEVIAACSSRPLSKRRNKIRISEQNVRSSDTSVINSQ